VPSTFRQNYHHAVFSTRQRKYLITLEIEVRLYPFLDGVVRDLRCTLMAIGGTRDHVHLLIRYRADVSISDVMRHIKGRSSKWINDTFPKEGYFCWREGYAGLTVSQSVVGDVEAYIARQMEHHKRVDFRSELLALLRAHGVEFDEADVFK